MATTRSLSQLPLLVFAGVASHLLYFNRYECHMYGSTYISTYLLGAAGYTAFLVNVSGLSTTAAIGDVLALTTAYLTGLFASLIIYRLFFNPLNKIPGPYWARLSNWWWTSQLGNSDASYKLEALHQKYGRFVRIGANDLSISDPDANEMAYGASAVASKSPWYDGDKPLTSMHTTRDKALHDRRRKVWAPAFSDKALRDYEGRIKEFNDKLVQRIEEHRGAPFDVTKWFNLYSFDAMGRLAFGKDYGMLDSGEKHWALELLSEGMQPLAYSLPIWFFRLLVIIPGAGAGYKKFVKFCVDELSWRVDNAQAAEGKSSDLMSWILKAYKDVRKPQTDPMLQADARLIIVAGSDTTAATLSYLFYHLAQEPEQVEKLRQELRPLAQGEWADKDIKLAPHLNGAINEALRLHPPVPAGLSRVTPPQGMQVGDTYIPGNATFVVPQYVLGRDESIYTDAPSFLPERWYSKPELVKHKDAFAPFSMGPMGCIGKNLALMELRTLTTQLLLKYDVKFAPGEDGQRILYKTLDHFTVDVGGLDLVFTEIKT